MGKKKILAKIFAYVGIFVLFLSFCAIALPMKKVYAIEESEIYAEIMGNMMQKCYNANVMASSININDYNNSGNDSYAFENNVFLGNEYLIVPTRIGNDLPVYTDRLAQTNCIQLIEERMGGVPSKNDSNLVSRLYDIGYTKKTTVVGGSTKCIKFYAVDANVQGETPQETGSICWDLSGLTGKTFNNDTLADFMESAVINYSLPLTKLEWGITDFYFEDDKGGHGGNMVAIPSGTTFEEAINILAKPLEGDYIELGDIGSSAYTYNITMKVVDGGSGGTSMTTDVGMTSYAIAYSTAREKLFGGNGLHDFTDEEKIDMYLLYLKNVYNANYSSTSECKKRTEIESAGGPIQEVNGAKIYYMYSGNGYYTVSVPTDKIDLVVAGFGGDKNFLTGYITFEQVIESIWNLTASQPNTCEGGDNGAGGGTGGGGSGGGGGNAAVPSKSAEGIADCNDLDDVGAMQWFLCPGMNGLQYTANALDLWVEDKLTVDSGMYAMNGGSGGSAVYEAWGYIRNIANALMILFLLVIIFSQLTGYGIDNYGIKKMLPRLIVMAIVVNLSYYLCVLAIDLSNIAGTGFRDMMYAVGNNIGGGSSINYMGGAIMAAFGVGSAASTGVAAGTSIAGLAAGGVTIAGVTLGPAVIAIVIAVIVALLLVLVAIFVLFAMLAIRDIIIIACLLLCPLAFAAYVLPNTQNLFKSWWNLFKTAIVIFPICGLFSGISYLLKITIGNVSNIGVAGALIFLVLPYIIFFLLPMLLKNVLSQLGKIGGALTSLGGTVRSGAQSWGRTIGNTVKNTEGYKNLQSEAMRRRQSDSADRTIARLEEIKRNGGQLSETQTRQLARAQETKRRLAGEDAAARTILAEKDYGGLALESVDPTQDTLINRWENAWRAGNTEEMNALTNVITSRHGPGGVNLIAQRLGRDENAVFNEDDEGSFRSEAMQKSFNALRENMQQNSSLANAMQNKASDAYQMISSGGYVERNAVDADGNLIYNDDGSVKKINTRANLATHSANNGIATQNKDWATQSSATLRRAIDAGQLSAEDAQALLNSTDPTIQSGLQSDKGKREVLQAAADGYRSNYNGDWGKDVVQTADGSAPVQMAKVRAENYQQTLRATQSAEMNVRDADRAQNAQLAADVQTIANAMRSNQQTTQQTGSQSGPQGGAQNNGGQNGAEVNIDHTGDGVDEIPE